MEKNETKAGWALTPEAADDPTDHLRIPSLFVPAYTVSRYLPTLIVWWRAEKNLYASRG